MQWFGLVISIILLFSFISDFRKLLAAADERDIALRREQQQASN